VNLLDTQIFSIIGDAGLSRLVAAFYARVPGDDILGPMYSGRDLGDAEWRLREFLVGRFGGPERYIEKRGHPRLRMRHNPFRIDQAARDRWMSLMEIALLEAQLPEEVIRPLRAFFHEAATFMINAS
jgi:hemoglobin